MRLRTAILLSSMAVGPGSGRSARCGCGASCRRSRVEVREETDHNHDDALARVSLAGFLEGTIQEMAFLAQARACPFVPDLIPLTPQFTYTPHRSSTHMNAPPHTPPAHQHRGIKERWCVATGRA